VNGLRTYFENLKTLYTKANEAKKCIDKIYEGIKRIDDHVGAVDYNSKDLINNRGIGKFEKLMKTAWGFEAIKRMLLLYQPDFIDAKNKGEEKLRPVTSRPQQNTNNQADATTIALPVTEPAKSKEQDQSNHGNPVETVIELPSTSENEDNGATDSSVESQSGILPIHEPITYHPQAPLPGQRLLTPTSTPLLGQQDIIAQLNNVLDQDEIWLLRRVFKVLNSFCPDNEHDQKLIADMERLIVKEFSDEI